MSEVARSSVIAYYMDRNWALQDVQLTFDEVDGGLFSSFESQLLMMGQGPTHWR